MKFIKEILIKDYKTRIAKLFRKIRIRVNLKTGEESPLDLEQVSLKFPAYGRALRRLSMISDATEKYPDREPKRAQAMTLKKPGFKLYKSGGGFLVRRNKKLAN